MSARDGNELAGMTPQKAESGCNWASYATDNTMTGFAAFSGTDDGGQSSWCLGKAASRDTTALLDGNITQDKVTPQDFTGMIATDPGSFGRPGPVMGTFENPTPQEAGIPMYNERCLEDLYREFREKDLDDIQQEAMYSAVAAFQQIAKDATSDWIRIWYPAMSLDKFAASIMSYTTANNTTHNIAHTIKRNEFQINEGSQTKNAFPALNDYRTDDRKRDDQQAHYAQTNDRKADDEDKDTLCLILKYVLDLKQDVSSVIDLFRRCITDPVEPPPTRLVDLRRILSQHIRLCRLLKDAKRRVLLEKTDELIENFSYKLDLQKILARIPAAEKLRLNNGDYLAVQPKKNLTLTLVGPKYRGRREKAERRILDELNRDLKPYRDACRDELLGALEVLLISSS